MGVSLFPSPTNLVSLAVALVVVSPRVARKKECSAYSRKVRQMCGDTHVLERFTVAWFMYEQPDPFRERSLKGTDVEQNKRSKEWCVYSARAYWLIAVCHSNLADTVIARQG